MAKINIYTSSYFEGVFKIFGYILIPVTIVMIPVNPVIGVVTGLLSILILTTWYKLKVDNSTHTFKEYLWILGFENGDSQSFQKATSVYVKPEKYVQKVSSWVSSREYRFTVYAVYIMIDNQEIFVGEFKTKDPAIDRARMISGKMDIPYYG